MNNSWLKIASPAVAVVSLATPLYAVQYFTVAEAQKLCFPQADRFEQAHLRFTPQEIAEIEKLSGQKVSTGGEQVWKAQLGEKLLGYFIVDYVIGKHLAIDYAVALTPEGSVKQVEIVAYRETYGGEIRGATWRQQFVGKTVQSALALNDDITNIGGATLSCRHVTQGIKRVLAVYETCLK